MHIMQIFICVSLITPVTSSIYARFSNAGAAIKDIFAKQIMQKKVPVQPLDKTYHQINQPPKVSASSELQFIEKEIDKLSTITNINHFVNQQEHVRLFLLTLSAKIGDLYPALRVENNDLYAEINKLRENLTLLQANFLTKIPSTLGEETLRTALDTHFTPKKLPAITAITPKKISKATTVWKQELSSILTQFEMYVHNIDALFEINQRTTTSTATKKTIFQIIASSLEKVFPAGPTEEPQNNYQYFLLQLKQTVYDYFCQMIHNILAYNRQSLLVEKLSDIKNANREYFEKVKLNYRTWINTKQRSQQKFGNEVPAYWNSLCGIIVIDNNLFPIFTALLISNGILTHLSAQIKSTTNYRNLERVIEEQYRALIMQFKTNQNKLQQAATLFTVKNKFSNEFIYAYLDTIDRYKETAKIYLLFDQKDSDKNVLSAQIYDMAMWCHTERKKLQESAKSITAIGQYNTLMAQYLLNITATTINYIGRLFHHYNVVTNEQFKLITNNLTVMDAR